MAKMLRKEAGGEWSDDSGGNIHPSTSIPKPKFRPRVMREMDPADVTQIEALWDELQDVEAVLARTYRRFHEAARVIIRIRSEGPAAIVTG